MRLTELRDMGEGNISEQRDQMIVNRGINYYRRDLIVKVKLNPRVMVRPLKLSELCHEFASVCDLLSVNAYVRVCVLVCLDLNRTLSVH